MAKHNNPPNTLTSVLQKLQIAVHLKFDFNWWKKTGVSEPGIDWTTRLPSRILSEIFLYFVLSTISPATTPCIEPCPCQGPLLVSQVSWRWREVALATPFLWSAIYIGRNPNLHLLKQWLARSGDAPLYLQLSMSFHQAATTPDHTTPPTSEVLDLFSVHIKRWKQFGFVHCDRPDPEVAFSRLPLGHAHMLEKVSVHIVNSPGPRGVFSMRNILSCIPSLPGLEEFSWNSFSDRGVITHPTWSMLKRIRLSAGLGMEEAFTFLAQCMAAIDIRLDCITDGYFEALHTSLVTLPKLRALRIADSVGDVTQILEYLSCPALEVLQFQNFDTGIASSRRLGVFLKQSTCSLLRLTIVDYGVSEYILLMMLKTSGLVNIPSVGLCLRKRQWGKSIESYEVDYPEMEYTEENYMDRKWVGRGIGDLDAHSRFLSAQ